MARRILGVDPGSRNVGYGIVEAPAHGAPMRHIASGTLVASHAETTERLLHLVKALEAVCQTHRPTEASMETAFAGRNVHSALVLGQARGALLVALLRLGLRAYEYAPSEIKLAVVGRGAADKEQVQHMVKLMLGLGPVPMGLDQSDALAVAICHTHASRWRAWAAPATSAAKRKKR